MFALCVCVFVCSNNDGRCNLTSASTVDCARIYVAVKRVRPEPRPSRFVSRVVRRGGGEGRLSALVFPKDSLFRKRFMPECNGGEEKKLTLLNEHSAWSDTQG